MSTVNEVLDQVEKEAAQGSKSFIIRLCNERSGLKEPLPVLPENTLGQILEESYRLVGTNRESNKVYFVTPTGQSTSDLDATVAELGLKSDDVLLIVDDGSVA